MRGHRLGWKYLGTVSALSLMINAAPVMAQDVDEEFLGIIELGASKREVQVGTATALTVINQEEIDDRQASTIAELIDSVPGVTLVNGSTPQGSGINIRGFGANGTYGTDSKVLIVVDGATTGAEELYRISTQLFTDPELYKEVSVIRGTVGSFEYGSGVVGGVVLLKTKDASDFTGGEIGLRLRQTLMAVSNGTGFASSTIVAWQPTKNLEFLLNYTVHDEAAYEAGNGEVQEYTDFHMPSSLVKGKYTFGENEAHSITVSYSDSTTDEKDVLYDMFNTTGPAFGNIDRKTHSKIAIVQYSFNPVGNDLVDLSVNLSHTEQNIIQDCTIANVACYPFVDADQNYKISQLTIKNSAFFTTGTVDHDLRVGIEFIKRDRMDGGSSSPGGTDKRVALFVVDEIQLNDNLSITPALRYETQDVSGISSALSPLNASYNNDALMGGLSARYEFDSGFAVFGSAAYTESLPIIDDIGTIAFMTQPEKSHTYEAGVSYTRGDLFSSGDALQVKVNLYDTYTWDITSYSGIANVQTQGIELEASYSHASGFYADLGATSAKGTQTNSAGVTERWLYSPETSARLTVGKHIGDEFDVSWELVAAQSTIGILDGALAGYGVNNLRATYKPQTGALKGAEFRFGVENILNATYQTQLSTRVAKGRNFKLTMAKTF